MDMDLWWCPVCERAITEQEEPVAAKAGQAKRASHPATQPRYTSRGGVYGPKGSLYCSEACREVEELNGRFAFEQLAACLPATQAHKAPLSEEPESEGTLSGTDDLLTDRSPRSLSLGRRSDSPTGHHHACSSISTEDLHPTTQRAGIQDPEPGQPSRRVPILISPNGTPLIQPTFPQRPALGHAQRRHQSHCPPKKRSLPHSTAVGRTSSGLKRTASTSGTGKACNSVPTYSAAGAGSGGGAAPPPPPPPMSPKTLLNQQPRGERNDMEFGAEARREKPASLLRHYGLFFRSRPGSTRGEWTDAADEWVGGGRSSSTTTTSGMAGERSVDRRAVSTSGLLLSRQASQASRQSSVHALTPLGLAAQPDPQDSRTTDPSPRKLRKHALAEPASRSWSWNHLPADVPQYPAMDLAQIRLSQLLRHHLSLQPPHHPDNHHLLRPIPPASHPIRPHPSSSPAPPSSLLSCNLASNHLHLDPLPIQTKKKLFIFH